MSVSIELHASDLREAVGSYIVTHKLFSKEPVFRLQRNDQRQEDGSRVLVTLGVGRVPFEEGGIHFTFIREYIGEPVTARSCDRDTAIHEIVQLVGPDAEAIQSLCSRAVKQCEADIFDHFQVYSYNAPGEFWQRMAYVPTRGFDSVILDAAISRRIIDDIKEFTCADTANWYKKHCIPLRRGYLFYGPPGTGKSSMIAAIASELRRSVHRMSLVAPRLTDDGLCLAISLASHPALFVFEDVDALFDTHRVRKEDFCVTFSGLLNAIDGVGDKHTGSLFIFTSNHPERLDAALTRKGRIDRRFEFGRMNADMARRMFLRFYPGADEYAVAFAANVMQLSPKATPVEMQHHFITHRRSDAATAAHEIVIDIEETPRGGECFYT